MDVVFRHEIRSANRSKEGVDRISLWVGSLVSFLEGITLAYPFSFSGVRCNVQVSFISLTKLFELINYQSQKKKNIVCGVVVDAITTFSS